MGNPAALRRVPYGERAAGRTGAAFPSAPIAMMQLIYFGFPNRLWLRELKVHFPQGLHAHVLLRSCPSQGFGHAEDR